tara:strand:+ start:1450 stop:2538 length:1089 start_codon:yes stop_codon:yes gene_type:complete
MEVITQIQKLMKEQTDSFEKELKDVKKEMNEIQNTLVDENEDTLASLNFYKEQCAELKEERKKLKEELAKVPALLEEERYKERSANERDWEDKEEEEIEALKKENEKIAELVISQTDKLKEVSIKYNEGYKINQELKEKNEELEYWREHECESPWEAIIMINQLTEENKKLKEKADAENTANMIDKLNEEYELLSEKNKELEKVVQSLNKQIGIWKNAHDEAVSTAIHYWSGGMHAECFASEVIPDQYRDADGDCIAHYSDLDEWNYCFGKVEECDDNGQQQLRFHISGGGDPNTPNGYEDWIVKSDGTVWISHGSRPEQNHLQEGKSVIMCPEQMYISIQKILCDGGDYELKMGEGIIDVE